MSTRWCTAAVKLTKDWLNYLRFERLTRNRSGWVTTICGRARMMRTPKIEVSGSPKPFWHFREEESSTKFMTNLGQNWNWLGKKKSKEQLAKMWLLTTLMFTQRLNWEKTRVMGGNWLAMEPLLKSVWDRKTRKQLKVWTLSKWMNFLNNQIAQPKSTKSESLNSSQRIHSK